MESGEYNEALEALLTQIESDYDDPFAFLVADCHVSSSQEEFLRNAPFARQHEHFDSSEPFSQPSRSVDSNKGSDARSTQVSDSYPDHHGSSKGGVFGGAGLVNLNADRVFDEIPMRFCEAAKRDGSRRGLREIKVDDLPLKKRKFIIGLDSCGGPRGDANGGFGEGNVNDSESTQVVDIDEGKSCEGSRFGDLGTESGRDKGDPPRRDGKRELPLSIREPESGWNKGDRSRRDGKREIPVRIQESGSGRDNGKGPCKDGKREMPVINREDENGRDKGDRSHRDGKREIPVRIQESESGHGNSEGPCKDGKREMPSKNLETENGRDKGKRPCKDGKRETPVKNREMENGRDKGKGPCKDGKGEMPAKTREVENGRDKGEGSRREDEKREMPVKNQEADLNEGSESRGDGDREFVERFIESICNIKNVRSMGGSGSSEVLSSSSGQVITNPIVMTLLEALKVVTDDVVIDRSKEKVDYVATAMKRGIVFRRSS